VPNADFKQEEVNVYPVSTRRSRCAWRDGSHRFPCSWRSRRRPNQPATVAHPQDSTGHCPARLRLWKILPASEPTAPDNCPAFWPRSLFRVRVLSEREKTKNNILKAKSAGFFIKLYVSPNTWSTNCIKLQSSLDGLVYFVAGYSLYKRKH